MRVGARSRPRPAGARAPSSAASTMSSRLSGPSGASCASRPMRPRGGSCTVAVLGRDFAGDGAEQRGLAGAVAPDQPDARAGRNMRRGAVEQQAAGDADRKIVDDEHGRAIWPSIARRRQCRERVATPVARGPASTHAREMKEAHMCVPGCQEAVRHALSRRGFFRARRPRPSPRPRLRRDRLTRRRAPVQNGGRSDPHHVAGLPDLPACRASRCRRSSTSRRTASISTGGGSSSMPARISMRRSISPKPA